MDSIYGMGNRPQRWDDFSITIPHRFGKLVSFLFLRCVPVSKRLAIVTMADIFISYANEDRESAAQVAHMIESAGFGVWWDRRIPAGRTWRQVLQDALRDMRCMVVLWSKNSVESSWVAEEAEEARRLGKTIVPILLERVEPPIGFRAIQAADLSSWDGSVEDQAAQVFLNDLKSAIGGAPGKPRERKTETVAAESTDVGSSWTASQKRNAAMVAAGAIVLAVGLTAWQFWPDAKPDSKAPIEGTPEKPPAPSLIGLVIDGAKKELQLADAMRLGVRGNYSDGTQGEIKQEIEWSSTAPQVVAVSKDGEVKALIAGSADIKAKVGAVTSEAWTIRVKAPPEPSPPPAPVVKLVDVRVTASNRELYVNGKISLRARGRYSDNSEQSLASGVEWQLSDRSLASINRAGELEGLRPGRVEVVARAGEVKSPPILVYIKEAPKPVPPVKPPAPVLSEQAKARIAAYIKRAEFYRGEGNYSAALAELEKAKTIDAQNDEIGKAVEQTRRACNAERVLGNKVTC